MFTQQTDKPIEPLTMKERDEIFDRQRKRYGEMGVEALNGFLINIKESSNSMNEYIVRRDRLLRNYNY